MNPKSILMIFLITLLSEVSLRVFQVPDYLFPRPLQVLFAFKDYKADLLSALQETSIHTIIGLSFSFIGGSLLALLISLSTWLRAGLLPMALFFQTVPIIAIAPMLVIWFGFGPPTVIASASIVSFFPILASTLQGLESTPKASLELFHLYRSNLYHLYFKLKIPYAIPLILNGVRVSMGLAVVGALVGEFIGGGGLGSLIDSARTQQRVDLVFAAVFCSCGLGWCLTILLDLSKKYLFKRFLL